MTPAEFTATDGSSLNKQAGSAWAAPKLGGRGVAPSESCRPSERFDLAEGGMMNLRNFVLAIGGLLAITGSGSAQAQYMYLDCNGDGINTEADILSAAGSPSSIDIYLDTAHNSDGSEMGCPTSGELPTLNSYEVILKATDGRVSFANFTNGQGTMSTLFGTAANDSELYAGFGGGAILPPGLYRLAGIEVTVTQGTPSLSIAPSSSLGATYETAFGTGCSGQDLDNTYKLGIDWHNISGCGPPGGGNAAPSSSVAPAVSIAHDQAVGLVSEFSDFNLGDSLHIQVDGLPSGLAAVEGAELNGRKQVRIYGILDRSVPDSTSRDVLWSVSDGRLSSTAHTQIVVRPPSQASSSDVKARVEEMISARYRHGLPNLKARALGSRALPILSEMLRDEAYRGGWALVAQAIGAIGDTAYFDTLRSFVWNRFRGEIDIPTQLAVGTAQGAMAMMATSSGRALDYLIASTKESYWAELPWRVRGGGSEAATDLMVRESFVALSYTDAARAGEALSSVSVPRDTTSMAGSYRAEFARGLQRVHAKVRSRGLLSVWQEQGVESTPVGR